MTRQRQTTRDKAVVRAGNSEYEERRPWCPVCEQRALHTLDRDTEWACAYGHRNRNGDPCSGRYIVLSANVVPMRPSPKEAKEAKP